MNAVLVNGLFPERNLTFLRELCRRCTVVGFGLTAVREQHGLPLLDGWEVLGRPGGDARDPEPAELAAAVDAVAACLREDAAACPLAPAGGWNLPSALIDELVAPRVTRVLKLRNLFDELHAALPLGLVVSNADYDAERRPVVLAARQAGVPTLNIDHGFYFNATFHRCKDAGSFVPTAFASDHVNVDNALEEFMLRDMLAPYPRLQPELLALGTPQDSTALDEVSRDEALARLGLEPGRMRVLLLGSWVEARSLGGIFAGQFDIAALYEDLLRSFASSPLAGGCDLLVKLHPAASLPDVRPGVTDALRDMAAGAGLPSLRVYGDRLPELLSVADVVVSDSFTSVLWEAFQRGIPAVLRLPRYWAGALGAGWEKDGTLPLEHGVMEAAADGADTWRRVADWLRPERRAELAARRRALGDRFGLTARDPQAKSEALCDWIAGALRRAGGGT